MRTCVRVAAWVVSALTALPVAARAADEPHASATPSPWIVEANAGVPKLDTSDLRLVGDGRLGYESARWGAIAHGGVSYYDLDAAGLVTDNLHASGAADAWWISADAGAPLRLDLRFSGGAEYYDATTISQPVPRGRVHVGDYDSLFVGGRVLVGLRWRPSDRFALDAVIGGGAAQESHDTTSVDARGTTLRSPDALSAQGSARLTARWRVVPDVIALRARAATSYFQITRDELTFRTGVGADVAETHEAQLDVSARAFLDADALRLFELVPALFAGVDCVAVDGTNGSSFASIPVAGVGITRVTDSL